MPRATTPTTRARRSRPLGFTKEELETFRGASVPDLIGDDCRLLFVGINPGLWTAATQTHFCHPSNRFYPALGRAGIIDWTVNPDTGMTDAQREKFVALGMGITNLVPRATVRASELSRAELRRGRERLRELAGEMCPRLVAVAGVTAYREAFGEPRATLGRQRSDLGPSALWVVPNPSGLNAHETIDTLADWYRRVAREAGVL
jgi:double-stranded uracil-DNA glycosylase